MDVKFFFTDPLPNNPTHINILGEELQWYYLADSWANIWMVRTFRKGINPKINLINKLEVELAYSDVA